jgi:hypothetical protein
LIRKLRAAGEGGHIDEALDRAGAAGLSAEAREHAARCARCAAALEAAEAAQRALAERRPVTVPRDFAAAVRARLSVAAPGLFERAWRASRGLVYGLAAACLLLVVATWPQREPEPPAAPLAELLEEVDGSLD